MPEKMHAIRNSPHLANLGQINRNRPQHSSYRIHIGSGRRRPAEGSPNGIPPIARNHGKGGGRCPSRTLTLRLQDQSAGRKHRAVGTHLPPLGGRAPDPEGVAKGNGENRENQVLHVPSRLTDPLCTKTTWTGTAPRCGLLGTQSNHDPESVSPTSHAGTARPSPRDVMVHQNGP